MPIVTVQIDTDTQKVMPLDHTIKMTEAVKDHIEHIGHAGTSILTVGWYDDLIAAAPDVQPVTLSDDVQMALEIAETIFEDAINRLVVGGDYEQRALETIRAALTTAPVQYLDWGSLIETIFIKTDILHEAQSPSDAIRKTVAWFQKNGIAVCLSNTAKPERQNISTVENKRQG